MADEQVQQQDPVRAKAAPLEPAEAQLELARQRTVRPPMPDLSNTAGTRPRAAPRLPVAASYRTQGYRFTLGGVPLRLSPDSAPAPHTAPVPPGGPFHLLSAWSPSGEPDTVAAFEQAHERLRGVLLPSGRTPVAATTVAGDRTWFERSVLVAGLSDSAAVELGVQFGQPAVVRWHDAALTVLPTGLREDVPADQVPCRLDTVAGAGCPVREDEDARGRCVGSGGPWTGSSRRAAVLWTGHRGLAVELLGCSSCADGREPAWGAVARGAAVSPWLVPSSRYGGPTL